AADPDDVPHAVPVPARPPAEMLQLLLGDLREQSAARVAARQAGAEQGVAVELERLDRYFASVLADKTDPDDVRTITALRERRRRGRASAATAPVRLAPHGVPSARRTSAPSTALLIAAWTSSPPANSTRACARRAVWCTARRTKASAQTRRASIRRVPRVSK